ncbi:cupin domain-containing protein [Oceanicaulis sp.]|uniref:cupin domain-containing protein n=1 Tax=Oceanicaulis sp. TaxID=1924941 RepID=UPI003BAC40E3
MLSFVVAALLAAHPMHADVRHADDLEDLGFPIHETVKLAARADTESGISVFEFIQPPRTLGAPPHRHAHEDELFYVLEGELSALAGEDTVTAGPGSLLILPRGAPHSFWNAGDTEARVLLIVSGSEFDGFFEAVAERLAASGPDADLPAILDAVAAAHGIEMLPHLMPDSARALLPPPG